MAGRKRTIDRKAQRADFDEDTEKAEEEEADDEEEEGDEDEEEGDEEADGEEPAEADADADDDSGGDDDDGDADDEDAPKKKKKKKKAVVAAPKKRATKKAVRQKAVWVVLDNSSKEVQRYPYVDKASAEKFVADKADDKKGYYIQMLKVPLDDK